jgi:hypothetical protein
MEIRRRDLALTIAVVLLLSVAIVRTAIPDRSRMRPLSIEGLTIASIDLPAHSKDIAEREWSPPTDVYVVGWSYHVPSTGGVLSLLAPPGDTLIFRVRGGEFDLRPQFVQAGTGYLIRRGQKLRARLHVETLEQPGKTHGAIVLVYFVPVEGN